MAIPVLADPRLEALTRSTLDACREVHRRLGPDLEHSGYEQALCQELIHRALPFQRRVRIPLVYRGVRLDADYRVDVCVAGSVVVDILVVDALSSLHRAGLRTRLRLTGLSAGIAVNFRATSLARSFVILRRKGRTNATAREASFDQTTSPMLQIATG